LKKIPEDLILKSYYPLLCKRRIWVRRNRCNWRRRSKKRFLSILKIHIKRKKIEENR
jgi:hypothetical protein